MIIRLLTFTIISLFSQLLFSQNSGSWFPGFPTQGDTITIICDPSKDSQTENLTISNINLYWGINGKPGSWKQPSRSIWPDGTQIVNDQAVTTPMKKNGKIWELKIVTNQSVSNLLFLFRANDNTIWMRDNGQDHQIELTRVFTPIKMNEYSVSDSSIRVFTDDYFMSVSIVQDNILKISFDDSIYTKTEMLLDNLVSKSPSIFVNNDSLFEIGSSEIKMKINKTNMSILFVANDGRVLLGPASPLQKEGAARIVRFSIGNEALYGLGEKGTDLNRRGLTFDTYNRANYGYNSALPTMKINIPFLTTTGGYALFFDNEYPADVSLKNQILYSARGGRFTYFIISGSLPEQLKGYHHLTGFQPLPPKWSLGFIQSKYGYKSETEVKRIANTFRELKIPADAMVLDLYWFGAENDMGNLSWNLSAFPDPVRFTTDMKDLGFKIIPIQETYLTTKSRLYSSFKNKNLTSMTADGSNYDIGGFWAGTAALIDMTNPMAQREWWNETRAITETGISGWWTDLGEPENHPSNMFHYLGTAEKVHNTYNLIWSKILFEGFNQDFRNQRFFNLTRSGTAGMQRYATFPWSGDVERSFNGLSLQPKIMLGMSLSGISYESSDLGGFAGPNTTSELYIRWMQFGAFNGIMRAHTSQQNPEPWQFGLTAQQIVKDYINLRYQLFPYIYTLAYRYSYFGEPIVRPLVFNFPNDPQVTNFTDEFLLGDHILIAPILSEGVTKRSVYFPEGIWYDYKTNQTYQQGNLTIATGLNNIPFFVRGGSIIPTIPITQSLSQTQLDTIKLAIYPNQYEQALGEWYDDDGETLDYQNGKYIATTFNFQSFQSDADTTISNLTITPEGEGFSSAPKYRTYITKIKVSSIFGLVIINDEIAKFVENENLFHLTHGNVWCPANNEMSIYIKTTQEVLQKTDIQVKTKNMSVGVKDLSGYSFELFQNYPNPFNPITVINYQLQYQSEVSLTVYDVLGRQVQQLVNENQLPGNYVVNFDATHLSSGIYFVRLQSKSGVKSIRMTVLK